MNDVRAKEAGAAWAHAVRAAAAPVVPAPGGSYRGSSKRRVGGVGVAHCGGACDQACPQRQVCERREDRKSERKAGRQEEWKTERQKDRRKNRKNERTRK